MREYGAGASQLQAAVTERLANEGTTPEEVIRTEHQNQASAQVSVANAITSLRLCSTLDWSQYFETVSLVEQVLQRDPSGVYGRMDFLSRDRYRQAVEELAEPSGEAQLRVALRSVESARAAAAASSPEHRSAHVGWHLIGRGRPDFEIDVAYHPKFTARARRFVFAHGTAVYLGAIGLLTLGLVVAAAAYVRVSGGTLAAALWTAALLLLPASELAIAAVQRLAAHLVPPRRLPRLDFLSGIPQEARTMVVIPTLLTSPDGVAQLLEHLEVVALGNTDPFIHFALLTDFADAPEQEMPGDAELLEAARAGIAAMNRRLGEGAASSSICSIGCVSGTLVKEPGSAGSANAGNWRNSITCCVERWTPASRFMKGMHRCSPMSATASPSTATPCSLATARASSSASSPIR
jgi:cyclic beta-1,2-glucan synthetase